MSKTYTARYGHAENCIPGKIVLDAVTDDEARAEVVKFVEDGYRNEAWASVTLSDGRNYFARNVRGQVFASNAD